MADSKDRPDALVFYCNGKKIVEENPDPQMNLNKYLRNELWLPGTKKSCGEGGCGACTAMVSYYDATDKKIKHLAVNTCITPVCSVHHMAVTTVEGIGSTRSKLHPVQERIAKSHGSQCGFCTPGFVMSMYALLRNNPQPSTEELDAALVGNLCRCTGYRPIVEAFQTFTKECCGGSNKSGCCQLTAEEENLGLTNKLYRTEDWTPYDPSQDFIFPPELKLLNESGTPSVAFSNKHGKWLCPVTLQELYDLMAKYPEAKVTAGNISVGFEIRYHSSDYPIMLCASRVPELLRLEMVDGGVFVGSAVTLTDLLNFLLAQMDKIPEIKTRFLSSLVELLKKFSGVQIRNVATVGGNLLSNRPSSDLRTIFMAAGCSLDIAASTASRKVTFDPSFYAENGLPKLERDELLIGILLPFTVKEEFMCNFKQSNRNGNDSAIVNAAMRVKFEEDAEVIGDMTLVFGGISGTKMATQTMTALKGRKWESTLVDDACTTLIQDLSSPGRSPVDFEKYKLSLALGFFFKFYLTVSEKRSNGPSPDTSPVPVDPESSIQMSKKMSYQSTQLFQDIVEGQMAIDPVGRPKAVKSALEHATGEARYVDDIPSAKNELFLAFVSIQSPHAKIISVDFSKALKVEGVVDVVTAEDIPGENFHEYLGQSVFNNTEVTYAGEPIAGVLAVNEVIARKAAKLVKVDYEELEFVVTTEDAIQKKSFYTDNVDFEAGDVELAFSNCEHIVSGEIKVGAQKHFYMETQSALVEPGREHREFNVHAACQNLNDTQILLSKVLTIPSNRVVCHAKRLGGGFGGKGESASIHAARTAVAANKVNCPVRCVLERQEDTSITGQRPAHFAKYRAGLSKEGKLQAVDWEVYVNKGPWSALSSFRKVIALNVIDNAYLCPNTRLKVIFCKTNIPFSPPMRAGCGVGSFVAMTESMMDHAAATIGIPAEKVRRLNLYQPNDITYRGCPLPNCTVRRCWDICLQRSDFTARKKAVEDFNRANRWIKLGLSITPAKYAIGAPKNLAQGAALVHIYLDGMVLVTHGGVEMGQGLYTKVLQIASRTLRIPMDRIHTSETSTNTIPNLALTHGSIGTDFTAPAVKDACETLLQRLEPYMRENPKGKWEEWVQAAFHDRVNLSATGHYKVPEDYFNPANFYYYESYGAAATEVEVDTLTGDHHLIRTDIVMDVGDSINPAVDIGQIEGGFIMGYGLYVLEDFRISQSGVILTKGPGSYKVPLASNLPPIFNVSLLHNSANPRAINSSKAVGEPPFLLGVSALSAIKDAIASARADEGLTEHFQLDTPVVPERIRLACQDKFTNKIPDPEPGSATPAFVRP